MRRALRLHPACERGSVRRIQVDIVRTPASRLELAFEVAGRVDELQIPPPAPPGRVDGLWRRTCFEAFIRRTGADEYLELNLSPSGEWAAYRFTGYRAGMAPAQEVAAPQIRQTRSANALVIRTGIDLSPLPDLSAGETWRIGLAAVIEDAAGRISYWALAHGPGKPDFHHSDGFACELRKTA